MDQITYVMDLRKANGQVRQQRFEVLLDALLGVEADSIIGAVLTHSQGVLGILKVVLGLLDPLGDHMHKISLVVHTRPCPRAARDR